MGSSITHVYSGVNGKFKDLRVGGLVEALIIVFSHLALPHTEYGNFICGWKHFLITCAYKIYM